MKLCPGIALTLLVAAALTLCPQPALAKAATRGEKVTFTGLVTDSSGQPIADVQVVLEASRKKLQVRRLRKEVVDTFKLSTTTNERGEYSLSWPWNEYYNQLELQVGVNVRYPDGERLRLLARQDVTKRAEGGSPVVVSMVVEDLSFLLSLRSFLATVDSTDERRMYQEMGKPDKVEQVGEAGTYESTWWYFESGRLYRFRAGQLVETKTFERVETF